ncbi:MAG TPA: M23 family metallopeptidase [Candidatus Aminicenantes bacterium]|nr:M23 family metallopeptidase [Candidatus Aminicenantes bacterium]
MTWYTLLWTAWLTMAGTWPGDDRPYRWPLPFQDGISSVVGEFRSTHLHAGIDLRTRKKTGFPVTAIGDGEITQIGVFQTNMGRSLVLRLADGVTAVYGHLSRFSPPLETIRRDLERREGKRFVGWFSLSGPLPVSAGTVIAYSGESGVGFPHLHLELRQADGSVLDPLRRLRFQNDDSQPPQCRSLLIRSRGASRVDGIIGETVLPLVTRHGVAQTPSVPVLSGPVDLVLRCVDLSDSKNLVTPALITASLDGQPRFRWLPERLSAADLERVGEVFDMEHSSIGSYWINLGTPPATSPGFVQGDPLGEGFTSLADGAHTLEVTVTDHAGQSTLLRFDFVKGTVPALVTSDERLPQAPRLFINRESAWWIVPPALAGAPTPSLSIDDRRTTQTIVPLPTRDGWAFPLQAGEGPLVLRGTPGSSPLELDLVTVRPEKPGQVRAGAATVAFSPGAVAAGRTFLLGPSSVQTALPGLVPPVELVPDRETFAGEVKICFALPGPPPSPWQVFIGRARPAASSWQWLPTHPEGSGTTFAATIRRGGVYGIFRDDIPPRLGKPVGDSRRHKRVRSVFLPLFDLESGIDPETVAATLNGHPVVPEYDPDRWRVILDLTDGPDDLRVLLRAGVNDIECSAADRAQNLVHKAFRLVLK